MTILINARARRIERAAGAHRVPHNDQQQHLQARHNQTPKNKGQRAVAGKLEARAHDSPGRDPDPRVVGRVPRGSRDQRYRGREVVRVARPARRGRRERGAERREPEHGRGAAAHVERLRVGVGLLITPVMEA